MKPAIAYDVLRLSIGPAFVTPRGIDRVDLALLTYLFDSDDSNNIGVLPTPFGVYALSAKQVRSLLSYVKNLWSEYDDAVMDSKLQYLLTVISEGNGDARPPRPSAPLLFRDKVGRMLRMLWATGIFPGRTASRAVPANAVYLNIGQLGLAMPSFFGWLTERSDISCAMMLHDAIPIDYPHLVSPRAPIYHRQMIRTAAERADCLIFNSAFTRDCVSAVLRQHSRPCPRQLVRHLPLPAAFFDAVGEIETLSGIRYFLVVSTVEPRKNHALLLRVWQRLIAKMGSAAPHLIIAGASGNDANTILAPLTQDPALGRRVHHATGLSSPALASLTLGATAMLCPSLAEGFGLPLLEASALGVPAIASDIPAHRELASAATALLPADDDDGWVRAITATPPKGTRRRPEIPHAMTEAAYCADIVDFVTDIHSSAR